MVAYIALIRKDEDSIFGVEFPDFPGCISAGNTLDKAFANAREALELHTKGMLEDGEAMPTPSVLEKIQTRAEAKDTVPVLIEVSIAHKNKRINITMDERLLKRVDSFAAASGTTRSAFLATAARHAIQDAGDP
ncbi:MAG: type II toxin-antitoxin system HicB family antitoxin [Deltaproteobacteria bacterium]|nr:type II toxin-antitoxin system HicB family antitoxin [Deltaproteobacteria bacterium]